MAQKKKTNSKKKTLKEPSRSVKCKTSQKIKSKKKEINPAIIEIICWVIMIVTGIGFHFLGKKIDSLNSEVELLNRIPFSLMVDFVLLSLPFAILFIELVERGSAEFKSLPKSRQIAAKKAAGEAITGLCAFYLLGKLFNRK